MVKKRGLSLSFQGLNYKLKIAFYLMSILPFLVSVYLISNYILPYVGIRPDITIFIIVSIVISFMGFFLIKQVFDRILSVSSEAKQIAAGNFKYKINTDFQDEIGDLGNALNHLTNCIRSNMDELNGYSEKTTVLNLEIQKRVFILSSLLQISSFISQGVKLDEILKIILEKARLHENFDIVYLLMRQDKEEAFTMRLADGANSQFLSNVKIAPPKQLFSTFNGLDRPLILDKENPLNENLRSEISEKLNLISFLALPVHLKGKVAAILGVGSLKELLVYSKDDVELLEIFAKQTAIAIENDLLSRRIEKLEIKDSLTGLYNEAFIRNCLQDEIKRAIIYHRPCAFILLKADNFQQFSQRFGSLQAESVLKKVASLIKNSVAEIERVARFGDDKFAIVLPEKNKRQALEVAESIRGKIEQSFSDESDPGKRLTVSGGVSENPLDGSSAGELIDKVESLLGHTDVHINNRITV